jgi:hypothetical protein
LLFVLGLNSKLNYDLQNVRADDVAVSKKKLKERDWDW